MLISNHAGYIDVLTMLILDQPSFLVGETLAKLPMLSTVAEAVQCMFVKNRTGTKEDRIAALE